MKKIYEMDLHTVISVESEKGSLSIVRVPGGWIYSWYLMDGLAMEFVPYSDEFADKPEKLQKSEEPRSPVQIPAIEEPRAEVRDMLPITDSPESKAMIRSEIARVDAEIEMRCGDDCEELYRRKADLYAVLMQFKCKETL